MPTQKVVLTKVPVKLSDGTKKVFIQSNNGVQFHFAESVASPDKTTFGKGNEVSMPEGFTIWAWTQSNIPLAVTVMTST